MLPAFELAMPTTLDEVLKCLASDESLQPFAGATNLVPDLRSRRETCRNFVSLEALDELRYIKRENGRVIMGARTTIADILADKAMKVDAPALYASCEVFAGAMVRTAATIGGNVCCGSPSADTVPPLLTLGADVTLTSSSGENTVPLNAFYLDYKKTVMQPGELMTSIAWDIPPPNSAHLFYKLGRRKGDAITVTGVSVMIATKDGICTSAHIALGSVGPTVFRVFEAETILVGKALDADLIEQAAQAASDQCSPIDDIRASGEYRKQTTHSLTRRLITQAWQQAS